MHEAKKLSHFDPKIWVKFLFRQWFNLFRSKRLIFFSVHEAKKLSHFDLKVAPGCGFQSFARQFGWGPRNRAGVFVQSQWGGETPGQRRLPRHQGHEAQRTHHKRCESLSPSRFLLKIFDVLVNPYLRSLGRLSKSLWLLWYLWRIWSSGGDCYRFFFFFFYDCYFFFFFFFKDFIYFLLSITIWWKEHFKVIHHRDDGKIGSHNYGNSMMKKSVKDNYSLKEFGFQDVVS